MSTVAAKGTAEGAGGPHGGPVTGLPWAVLRLHRPALVLWVAFLLAAVATLVWETEVTAEAVHERLAACGQNPSGPNSYVCPIQAQVGYSGTIGWASTLVYYSFFAVAAFAGGALIGREMENGTARLAWTQSVSPTRWLAAKLAVPALLLTIGGTVFVFAFRWAWVAQRDLMSNNWASADIFAARGPVLVAYSLCALAVGALAGVVLRRSLPALAVSCGVMYLINHILEEYRPHLWSSKSGDSSLGEGWRSGKWEFDDLAFQPESHYWPMHLVETGIVLAITLLATGAAFWVLRRRTA
ncbi:hypothetical protein AB0D14_34680 [Streptomyces sp. NPDC048484]|uniref:hypothetical protein n=1 Tax=Streptomyces sp. NPDC048484 TaxID=3155146 RepID=UPI003416017C